MKNIVLARVDDRLIHGEVVSLWTPYLSANRIIIIDDSVAADKFNSRVLKLLAPSGIKVDVYTIKKASERLKGDFLKGERIILLAKTTITFNELVKKGVNLKEVNLGGMGIKEGRTPFIKNVSCSPEEVDAIRDLVNQNVHVFYQLVPEQKVIEVTELI